MARNILQDVLELPPEQKFAVFFKTTPLDTSPGRSFLPAGGDFADVFKRSLDCPLSFPIFGGDSASSSGADYYLFSASAGTFFLFQSS